MENVINWLDIARNVAELELTRRRVENVNVENDLKKNYLDEKDKLRLFF